jgi:hypothetical protein
MAINVGQDVACPTAQCPTTPIKVTTQTKSPGFRGLSPITLART